MFNTPANGGDPDDHDEPTAAEAHAEHLASCSDCRSGNHGDCEEGSELLLDALEDAETTLLEPIDRFDLGGEG